MLSRIWQQWPSALQRLRYSRSLGRTVLAYSTDQKVHKKPYISQKVKFVDQLRVVARGGQGGGGSSALFGRTGDEVQKQRQLLCTKLVHQTHKYDLFNESAALLVLVGWLMD